MKSQRYISEAISCIHVKEAGQTQWPAKSTHWGRVTHICLNKLTIIGSDNGLSPGRRQAIIWTNAGILLIRPLGTNFSEIIIGIQTFSFTKKHLKMSSAKWCPFCLGLNVITYLSYKPRHTLYEPKYSPWLMHRLNNAYTSDQRTGVRCSLPRNKVVYEGL